MDIKGVITGDIVGSSQIKPELRGDLLTCLSSMQVELQYLTIPRKQVDWD